MARNMALGVFQSSETVWIKGSLSVTFRWTSSTVMTFFIL